MILIAARFWYCLERLSSDRLLLSIQLDRFAIDHEPLCGAPLTHKVPVAWFLYPARLHQRGRLGHA
jgi:hypothetical protein